ncbi:hypothetical protein L6R46_23330 [Myxococcota bacterium]|nr:hypothetical protein [Myxococcota bacterium]
MRALPLFPLLLLGTSSLFFTACADDPCNGQGVHRLTVVSPGDTHQLVEGDPRRFSSIQDALDFAEPGVAVCVSPGVYREAVRMETDSVRLIGAGAGRTILESRFSDDDPLEGGDTVLGLYAAELFVSGFTLRGGARGVVLDGEAEAELVDLLSEENGVGLLALDGSELSLTDVSLVRNGATGALLYGEEGAVVWTGGEILGNGTLGRSDIGGVFAERDLYARDLRLRDNVGELAGDLLSTGTLLLEGSTLDRPSVSGGGPRLVSQGGAVLRAVSAHTDGAAVLQAACRGGAEVRIENLALTDVSPIAPAVRLQGCPAEILHGTFVDLSGEGRFGAVSLGGDTQLTLRNTAVIGYGELTMSGDRWNGALIETNNFLGTAAEASLLRTLEVEPDLRPQSDSPLVDAGAGVSLAEDLDGRPRPSGLGPDIGAYEHY